MFIIVHAAWLAVRYWTILLTAGHLELFLKSQRTVSIFAPYAIPELDGRAGGRDRSEIPAMQYVVSKSLRGKAGSVPLGEVGPHSHCVCVLGGSARSPPPLGIHPAALHVPAKTSMTLWSLSPQRARVLSEWVTELQSDVPNSSQKPVCTLQAQAWVSLRTGGQSPRTCWTPLSLSHGESKRWDPQGAWGWGTCGGSRPQVTPLPGGISVPMCLSYVPTPWLLGPSEVILQVLLAVGAWNTLMCKERVPACLF